MKRFGSLQLVRLLKKECEPKLPWLFEGVAKFVAIFVPVCTASAYNTVFLLTERKQSITKRLKVKNSFLFF